MVEAASGARNHHHPLRALPECQLQGEIEVGLVLVGRIALDRHVGGDGNIRDRVEIPHQHIDTESQMHGHVVAAVRRHHEVGGGQLVCQFGAGEVATGEDQDGVHE